MCMMLRKAVVYRAGMNLHVTSVHNAAFPDSYTDDTASTRRCTALVSLCQRSLIRAELYDEAASMLREHAEELPGLSERLRRFLALGSALALMRAGRAWATHEASSGAAGSAVASLQVRNASYTAC